MSLSFFLNVHDMPLCVCVNKDIVAELTDSCTFTAHGLTPPVQQKAIRAHICPRQFLRSARGTPAQKKWVSILFSSFFTDEMMKVALKCGPQGELKKKQTLGPSLLKN